jgi:DNA-binding NarL/FixJ family response regulator
MNNSSGKDDINVWIIEDNDLYRNNLAALLNQTKGIKCSYSFSSCEDALKKLKKSDPPDIILIDIGLPGMNGIDGIRMLRDVSPEMQIIVLTVYDDDQKIFNALCAGASGYLLKSSPDDKIIEAINEVLNGGAPMNAHIARKVLNIFITDVSPKSDYGLTNREKDILSLVVEGLPKKQIANQLNVSYYTVDTHIKNIYTKLQVQSSSAAVAKALKEKLI